LCINS